MAGGEFTVGERGFSTHSKAVIRAVCSVQTHTHTRWLIICVKGGKLEHNPEAAQPCHGTYTLHNLQGVMRNGKGKRLILAD